MKVDERVFAHLLAKTLPTSYLLQTFYPHLYPVHALNDEVGSEDDGCSLGCVQVPVCTCHLGVFRCLCVRACLCAWIHLE